MNPSEESSRSDDGRGRTFATQLSALKESGSALLVVGNLPEETYQTVCRRMLGDARADRRRLLVVTGERPAAVSARLPPTADASSRNTRLIAGTTDSRAAAAGATPNAQIEPDRVDLADLSELGRAISAAIERFDEDADSLDPAELRVCFDSLRPVIGEHDDRTVFRFVDLLAARIRSVRGMGHFHLPIARDDELVRTFEPLFDAVVELRKRDGRLEQRWRLCDSGLSSGWLEL